MSYHEILKSWHLCIFCIFSLRMPWDAFFSMSRTACVVRPEIGHKVDWPRLEECYNVSKCKFFQVKLEYAGILMLDFDHL